MSLLYIIMSPIDAVCDLCDILVESNLLICEKIQEGKLDKKSLYSHFKYTAEKIRLYGEFLEERGRLLTEPQGGLFTAPEFKEEARDQYNGGVCDKLISRIEKIKQDRQKDIENDKKWSEMDGENDELIERNTG